MMKRANTGFTLVEIMIAIMVIAIILAVAIPNFLESSKKSRSAICVANLSKIDTAVDQWALQENISQGRLISESDADAIYSSNIKGGWPKCPSGGAYSLHEVGVEPQVTCSKEDEGHKLH